MSRRGFFMCEAVYSKFRQLSGPRARRCGHVRSRRYQIDNALVPVLDEIEEVYPGVERLFRAHRLHVEVTALEKRERVDCLIYPVTATAVAGRPGIESGDWVEHRATRA